MRIAIVSDTPYQVFNAIRLVRYNSEFKDAQVDLFLGHQFIDSDKIAERIKKHKVFDSVYDYYPIKKIKKTRRVLETLFPIYGIQRLMKVRLESRTINYDVVFLSLITEMSMCLFFHNNKCKIFYYDDGSGSYSRRMKPLSVISKSNQRIYRILGKNLNKLNICGLFLNNPDMYNSDDFDMNEIYKIDPEGRCKFSYIESVFDVGNLELYRQNRFIYLTDPGNKNDYVICNEINRIANGILIRPHPRQLEYSLYKGKIDENPGMWELLAMECISSEHVLISGYSTAQMTPFILYGKEPFLIFTYRLNRECLQKELINNIESMIDLIREKYSDKSKIIVINDYNELKKIIAEVIDRSSC